METEIFDADAHVLEPANLWTDRVPAKLKDIVPSVGLNPRTNHHHWKIGNHWLWPVGQWAQAGWSDYPPNAPWEFEDVDPASYDAKARLERMNEFGITAQVLYPNLIGFQAPTFVELGEDVANACTRAYNDFLVEWSEADPERLIPIAMLPYWNRDEAVKEMKRCVVELGMKGVLFANKFEKVGLPGFCDPYWDPVYQAAQDYDIAINYHIGFSAPEVADRQTDEALLAKRELGEAWKIERARISGSAFMAQCDLLGTILLSGLCDRFPTLKLVSVETGFGQIPFYLELLDWTLATGGLSTDLKPSEYFARQCYGTLWFETTTLALLDQYPDNFMFSTDFPHPTSLSPGPASPAKLPSDHVADAYAELPEDIRSKVLSGNTRAVYKLGEAAS